MTSTQTLPHRPESAADLASLIGRKDMEAALGVGKTAISNAVVRGVFPSSWFVTMDSIARNRGIECPPRLFGMREHNAGA